MLWYRYRYFDIIMILWCCHDISKYQASPQLNSSWKTVDIMILLLIFWYYHDIMMLSWYLKISSPCTPTHIQANIWYYDIAINILILSWYLTIIRRRRSEYWWIFPETKSRGIFTNIHEPEVNNCFSIITQVIIEIPKLRNVTFYHNCC